MELDILENQLLWKESQWTSRFFSHCVLDSWRQSDPPMSLVHAITKSSFLASNEGYHLLGVMYKSYINVTSKCHKVLQFHYFHVSKWLDSYPSFEDSTLVLVSPVNIAEHIFDKSRPEDDPPWSELDSLRDDVQMESWAYGEFSVLRRCHFGWVYVGCEYIWSDFKDLCVEYRVRSGIAVLLSTLIPSNRNWWEDLSKRCLLEEHCMNIWAARDEQWLLISRLFILLP